MGGGGGGVDRYWWGRVGWILKGLGGGKGLSGLVVEGGYKLGWGGGLIAVGRLVVGVCIE